jgi:hypothetical protein
MTEGQDSVQLTEFEGGQVEQMAHQGWMDSQAIQQWQELEQHVVGAELDVDVFVGNEVEDQLGTEDFSGGLV